MIITRGATSFLLWLCLAMSLPVPATATTPEEEDATRRANLVIANHILAAQGIVDGFGHISVRSAKNPNHYFISRSKAPALVTAEDIMEIDLEDNPIDAHGRGSYLERFIHSEIYKARPDVISVVHSHSPAVIPFSVVPQVPLRPVSHMAGFLHGAVPVFEIRNAGGDDTDMLIRNKQLGAALAKVLGNGTAALLRGHGDVVVGNSIQTAVLHAVYTDLDARLESEALELGGKITFLNEREAARIGDINDQQVERPWELWKRNVQP
jgi:HCOMODA/2-hydroxy-3-carboxy-muconic semialdehyde decarboxylase